MSFFTKKNKEKQQQQQQQLQKQQHKKEEKDGGGSGMKSQFYVEFLGWMECRGVRGRRYTDPAIQELKRRQKKMDRPPKLTIQLTAKELKISQDFEEGQAKKGHHKNKGGGGQGIRKVTFPPIPAHDVTYVVQATRDSDQRLDDVVACIFLGYMPRTGKYVHVHVYRFDEPSTASTFAKLMGELVAANLNRINEVERDLAEKGEIDLDPTYYHRHQHQQHQQHQHSAPLSDGFSDDRDDRATGTDSAAGGSSSSPTFGSDDMEADLQSLNDVQPFDSVAEELRYRLRMNDGPLLLPPKDYDTISRARGNLMDINDRRCLALNVVGEGVKDHNSNQQQQQQRPRNGSEESGIDLASPGSDNGDVLSRFPPSAAEAPPGSAGSDLPAQGVTENGFVYPPRPERVSAGDVYPPRSPAMSPALHRAAAANRFSPQGSPYGTRSSRTSHHSNHSGGSTERVNRPVYSRSNSSSSNPPAHLGNSIGSNSSVPPINVVGPMMMPPHDDGGFPPMDYPTYDDDDSFNEPVVMRRPGGSFHHHQQRLESPRPHSGNPMGGSPMLMRSMPAKMLHSEMALSSPRSPRAGLGSSGPLESSGGGDEYFFNAQRRSQPVYASHGVLDMRPHSAEMGHVPRRGNSFR